MANWFGKMMGNYQKTSYPDRDLSSGNHSNPSYSGQYPDARPRSSARQQRGRNDDEIDHRRIQDLVKQYQSHKPDQVMQEMNRVFAAQDQLITSLLNQNKTLYDQTKSLGDENRRLQGRIDDLTETAFSQSQRGMMRTYPVPVDNVQPWRSVSCHLLEDPSSLCHWAVDAFVDKVSSHFQPQRINLMVNRLQSITSGFVSNGQPVVLPCLNSCRLGTDVKTAYKKYGIAGRKVILLVFHHQPSHAKFGAGSQVLLDADLHRNATLILDVLYQTNEGVYDCSQNTDAITSLVSHIQTEQNS